MLDTSSHYLLGPLVAALAMGVIVLLCRWTFSTSTREERAARRRALAAGRGDYGLLVPVATTRTPEDAELLRELLRDAGIRCTVAQTTTPVGSWQLLVFRSDARRASELVRS